MRERVQLGVAFVEGQDGGAHPPRVINSLQQRHRSAVLRDDKQRLAPLRRLQPGQPHGQVRAVPRRAAPTAPA